MILRTVFCGVKNCKEHYIEKYENEGWPGWGIIKGLADERGYPKDCYCCPKHLQKIKEVLNIEDVRRDERKKLWVEVGKYIKSGPLQGDGRDKSAERNGLILAKNIIFNLGV
jgi:hypothetical protein